MSGRYFLDSNVLLYSFDETDLAKQRAAHAVVREALVSGDGVISYQVVQEVLNVLMRKLRPGMPPSDAMLYVTTTLEPLWRVQPSSGLFRSALVLQDRHSFSWYDALIVSSALSAGCDRLLTEDMQDGRRVDGLTIENPFRK